jgi:hypothetical protein
MKKEFWQFQDGGFGSRSTRRFDGASYGRPIMSQNEASFTVYLDSGIKRVNRRYRNETYTYKVVGLSTTCTFSTSSRPGDIKLFARMLTHPHPTFPPKLVSRATWSKRPEGRKL